MASGKVTAIAFLLMFIVVCSDFSSVMVADAATCCGENRMDYCINEKCHTYCQESCRGGQCMLRNGKYGCHCYC
ncbi:hypothetical protein C5167_025042 [Papaver somniferum]|uniref:Knottin scorpion toxin-like domain-containing protein n=1 Tax=Papaver somniferum TaxID=3469 RepID=A0A4Y7JU12_PAPSO|nr:hypothetical protein C5167_025042 [Papaver somniferum]